MSRIGKKPISIPQGVTVEVSDRVVKVKGPQGENLVKLHPEAEVTVSDNVLEVRVKHPEVKEARALWGLTRALLANAVTGAHKAFQKKLEMVGV